MLADAIDGSINPNGFLLRVESGTGNMVNFGASEAATSTDRPELSITYSDRMGHPGVAAYRNYTITDRASMSVNVTNGNAIGAVNEFSITGTGLNLSVQRFFNGLNTFVPWTWSLGRNVNVKESTDGTVTYVAGDQSRYVFVAKKSGGYFTPPGLPATLSKSGSTWTITFKKSHTELQFQDRAGINALVKIVDRNNNDIELFYTFRYQ